MTPLSEETLQAHVAHHLELELDAIIGPQQLTLSHIRQVVIDQGIRVVLAAVFVGDEWWMRLRVPLETSTDVRSSVAETILANPSVRAAWFEEQIA